ncbi:MAG: hybrid sensor histidine kinase/response regulator, partial [Gemmatimonadota bacterium]
GVLLEGLRSSFDRVHRVTRDLEAERSRLLRTNRDLEQEIGRRQQAEEERARLATAMEQAADAVAILDLDGSIRYVNRAFGRMFDRDRTELLGADVEETGLFADPDTAARVMATLESGQVWVGRLPVGRDDTAWHAQASFSTLRDQAGQPSHRLAVIRDVSREAQLEQQLQQAQKMKAMGTFAGGIAHDFNNLLVPILGTAELLAGQARADTRQQLEDIARSARRGRELVAQIMAFSRGGRSRDDTVCLATVVRDSERLLRASLPANIELEFTVRDRGAVHASEAEVQQVLMNLCTNAFHAMRSNGGTLRVQVDRVRGREVDTRNAVAAGPPAMDQEYVRLTVVDTGEGMDAGTLARVFEPFFTTKPDGEGTGLGLAMVHGVASGAGGTLVIRSRKGQGTTVEVLLPRGSEPEEAATAAPAFRRGRGQRVVVVDDEQSVRTVVGRFLERLGYQPRLVEPAAAEALLASDTGIDLFITDLSMPRVTGLELGRLARTLRPSLPMILSTGLVDQDTVDRARNAGFAHVLAKPFEMAELAGVLTAVLGAADPAGPGGSGSGGRAAVGT